MFRSPLAPSTTIRRLFAPPITLKAMEEPPGANAGAETAPSAAATSRSVGFDPATGEMAYTPGFSRRYDTNAISREPCHEGENSLDEFAVTCVMPPVASVSIQTS